MVRMSGGFIDPTDEKVEGLKGYIERLAVNSGIGVDITQEMNHILKEFSEFDDKQKQNFISSLVFNYVAYYGECFKARERAAHCKQFHTDRR